MDPCYPILCSHDWPSIRWRFQPRGDDMRMKISIAAAAVAAASLFASLPAAAQGLPLTNKGGINPQSWVYGPRNNDTSGGAIWNPVKQKMIDGQVVIGRTVSSNNLETMNTTYCSQAS